MGFLGAGTIYGYIKPIYIDTAASMNATSANGNGVVATTAFLNPPWLLPQGGGGSKAPFSKLGIVI